MCRFCLVLYYLLCRGCWRWDLGLLSKLPHSRPCMQAGDAELLNSVDFCNWNEPEALSGMFPWALELTPPSLHHLPHRSDHQLWCGQALPVSRIRSRGCLAWLLTVVVLFLAHEYRARFLTSPGTISGLLFPNWFVLGSEAAALIVTPSVLILLSDFLPFSLTRRLWGRDCLGWNLTRHRWFASCKFFSSCWPPTNSWSFHSSFCGGGRRRGRKGQ